jgi:hypothetical protein
LPGTWVSLLLFLLFIAPGLFYDLRSERRKPGEEETTFREAGRVALSSVLLSGSSFLLFALASCLAPTWFIDLAQYVKSPTTYIGQHFWLATRSLAYQEVLALGLAEAAAYVQNRRYGGPTISPIGVWFRVFHAERPANHEVYVRVRLTDGSAYAGTLKSYTSDINNDSRDISLGYPIRFRKAGKAEWNDFGKIKQRMVINESQIRTIDVEYHQAVGQAAPAQRLRLRWPVYRG